MLVYMDIPLGIRDADPLGIESLLNLFGGFHVHRDRVADLIVDWLQAHPV